MNERKSSEDLKKIITDGDSSDGTHRLDRIDLEVDGSPDEIVEVSLKDIIEGKDEKIKEKNKTDFNLQYIRSILIHFPWYHGLIQSIHVKDILKWESSFVVRRSGEDDGNDFFCLSVRLNNTIWNYAFQYEKGFWTCSKLPIPDADKNTKFPHIHSVIDYWSLKHSGCIPVPRKFVILHEDVKFVKKLGEGAFGEVWKGTISINNSIKQCAIKKIKGQIKREQISAFFHESMILTLFDHECVVKFYGHCTLISPLMAIMELASGGTVRSYLRGNRNAQIDDMISFVNDIARGMEHLISKRVIHRDLAARNCLIGENMIVKISDFGLSIRCEEIKVKTLKQAPMRWLSPETLKQGLFNEKTDVWSFGVVIWEIFTYCSNQPLYPKNVKDACIEIKNVDKPHKFDPTKKLPPKEIVKIMENCTRQKPNNRPKFRFLAQDLAKIMENHKKMKRATSKRRGSIKKGSERGIFGSNRMRKKSSDPISDPTASKSKSNERDSKSSEIPKHPGIDGQRADTPVVRSSRKHGIKKC